MAWDQGLGKWPGTRASASRCAPPSAVTPGLPRLV